MFVSRPQAWLGLALAVTASAQTRLENDTLGISGGYTSYQTNSFLIGLVKESQTLASLVPSADPDFDFLLDKSYLALRAADGQYQLGDVILRYRASGKTDPWTTLDSASYRQKVTNISSSSPGVIASANLGPTLNAKCKPSIDVVRTWARTTNGDLTLSFRLRNTRKIPIELGGLGFPMVSDSIFARRKAVDLNANCSLIDPNIGLNGGYLRFTRLNGKGPAMVVTPLTADSGLEGWGFLHENKSSIYNQLNYQEDTFEGYYQYMPLTLAYAENEWNATQPWNQPTSKVLPPGGSITVGFRFTVVEEIENIENTVASLGVPVAKGMPGYILPGDLDGQLSLQGGLKVHNIAVEPKGALQISETSGGSGDSQWLVSPQSGHLGRARVTIEYEDGRKQSVHYYTTKSAPVAVDDAGRFLNDRHWWTDTSDWFGRAPSFMCVDHSDGVGSLVLQDYHARVWLSGESHEAGASWYTMALKQLAQPDAEQVDKMEQFVDGVLWKTIQLPDYSVLQSIFWYDPNITDFSYNPAYPWWPQTSTNYSVSWNEKNAHSTRRSYGYVYPATVYWILYRVGRAFPALLTHHTWDWYLNQAYETVAYAYAKVDGSHVQPLWYNGLMGETAFGELLKDLQREGWDTKAAAVEDMMRERAERWDITEVPFGSELGWDCTGQEGVFYWANYFGNTATADKTIETIRGYMPAVSHWAYHGNARRFWDFTFGGKLDRIERQIHHYGSALNALPLLRYARANPGEVSDYLVRLAYGGLFAPLSNIHDDGFASAAFHSWPETLAWDDYSGDYGLSFAGLVLGSATFIRDRAGAGENGLQVFGGVWNYTGGATDKTKSASSSYNVWPRDAIRRRLYIEPMQLFIELDSGAISVALVDPSANTVTLEIVRGASPNATPADECVIWLDQDLYGNATKASDAKFKVSSAQKVVRKRGGWAVSLREDSTEVEIRV